MSVSVCVCLWLILGVERISIKKGVDQGIQQGRREGFEAIEIELSVKFDAHGLKFLPEIKPIEDINRLEMIKEVIKEANDISEVEEVLR